GGQRPPLDGRERGRVSVVGNPGGRRRGGAERVENDDGDGRRDRGQDQEAEKDPAARRAAPRSRRRRRRSGDGKGARDAAHLPPPLEGAPTFVLPPGPALPGSRLWQACWAAWKPGDRGSIPLLASM